ncbi:MAG: hypothetical protein ACK5Q5_11800 [Planctomycetaceae bacterium]
MSRRHEDQAFGSDSFLDIIANVVGILIILIVVAGVKVSRLPVLSMTPPVETAPQAAEPVAVVTPPASPPVAEPPPAPEASVWEEPEIEEPPRLPPRVIVAEKPLPDLPVPVAPRELVVQSETLRQTIAQLDSTRARLQAELSAASHESAQSEQQLKRLQSQTALAAQATSRERQDLAAGEKELAATREQLARLQQLLVEAEQDVEPAATPIQHRVTPIGRAVHGQELHYYLSQGRVAYVPVEELARRLRNQIDRQKEIFAKMERYEGSLDPLDGFRMSYVIQRSPLSLQEELKFGQGIIRMQVSQWVLTPEPGLESETPEQAQKRGSKFYQSLLTAGPLATLTFWVYPDSFDACRELKEFAHQHGYDVAARPLPYGVPIAGSPDGSRSVAQ